MTENRGGLVTTGNTQKATFAEWRTSENWKHWYSALKVSTEETDPTGRHLP